jgi:hypothetical protein
MPNDIVTCRVVRLALVTVAQRDTGFLEFGSAKERETALRRLDIFPGSIFVGRPFVSIRREGLRGAIRIS